MTSRPNPFQQGQILIICHILAEIIAELPEGSHVEKRITQLANSLASSFGNAVNLSPEGASALEMSRGAQETQRQILSMTNAIREA